MQLYFSLLGEEFLEEGALLVGRCEVGMIFRVIIVVLSPGVVKVVVLLLICMSNILPFLIFFFILILLLDMKSSQRL